MKKGTHVQLTKRATTVNPVYRSGNSETYKYGRDNGAVSLPIDYVLKGTLLEDISFGNPIKIDRYDRNGVATPGLFLSSPVLSIEGNIAHTMNSQYEVIELPPLPL